MTKAKTLLHLVAKKLTKKIVAADRADLEKALSYIDGYWENLTKLHQKDEGTIIGLKHPYVVPASQPKAMFTFEEQYYWDSYFTALGLAGGKHQNLADGMLENLLELLGRFSFIPNANRMYHMSHSQPPVLTRYIRLIFETGNKNKAWLREKIAAAEREYKLVWMSEQHPMWHQVHKGLSRYYDINVLHDLAEAESGWDMTPRFERKCLDYLPIDLNSLLFVYETDFAWAAGQLGDRRKQRHWESAARHRQHEIHKLMWHQRKGFFFDYNYNKKQKGDCWSLAGYFAMWSGVATQEQAAAMVKNLSKFEHVGGLSTTTRPLIDTTIFGSLKTQWAYPNGWAPLQWIVIEGLERYGYHVEAKRLAHKWLHTNIDWFKKHHEFMEKYNVVSVRKHPVEGLYPSQAGFGWTNSIFVYLAKKYGIDLSDG